MKCMFMLDVHSVVDVITNSSSELFVGDGVSLNAVEEMVKEIYPDYLREYDEIKSTTQLNEYEMYLYVEFHYGLFGYSVREAKESVFGGFTFDDIYEMETIAGREFVCIREDFVPKNRERLNKLIDPNNTKYFMFSHDDNPDWSYQNKLQEVMKRYHLG